MMDAKIQGVPLYCTIVVIYEEKGSIDKSRLWKVWYEQVSEIYDQKKLFGIIRLHCRDHKNR